MLQSGAGNEVAPPAEPFVYNMVEKAELMDYIVMPQDVLLPPRDHFLADDLALAKGPPPVDGSAPQDVFSTTTRHHDFLLELLELTVVDPNWSWTDGFFEKTDKHNKMPNKALLKRVPTAHGEKFSALQKLPEAKVKRTRSEGPKRRKPYWLELPPIFE